jgi:hypothetical protein
MRYWLTGGFLRGKRTYIIAALMIFNAVAQWAVGDATAVELLSRLPDILEGLGLMTLRAAVAPYEVASGEWRVASG